MKLERLNIIILLLFPVFALGAIKLTNSILPAQYYFSISKLAKGADEPFIVEPPSVTEEKFCDLLKKYRVDASHVNLPYIDCGRIYAAQPSQTATQYTPSADEKDQIYRIAFQADQAARETLLQDTKSVQIPVLTDEQLDAMLAKASSPLDAFEAIGQHYASPYSGIRYNGQSQINTFFVNAFQKVVPTEASDQQAGVNYGSSDYKPSDLKPEEAAKIKEAHRRFVSALAGLDFAGQYKAISVTDIEKILKNAYSAEGVPRDFAGFYAEQNQPILKAALRSEFEASKVDLTDSAALRKEILTEASQSGIFNYVVAAIARVMPIFIVALFFGLYFGRREVFSIAVGAGLLAFLLVWPILLMWDTVVQSQWAEYKMLFVVLYLLYVAAFFAVGHSGSLIGAAVTRRFGLQKVFEDADAPIDTTGRIQVREILISLVSSGIFSFLAFSLNLIVPLQA